MNTTIELSSINHTIKPISEENEQGLENQSKEPKFTSQKSNRILYFISALSTVTILANSAFYPSLNDIQTELQITKRDIDILISGGLLINGLAPIIWGTLSDNYGRKLPYILTTFCSLIGTVGFSLARNKGYLLISKIMQEMGSSGSFTVAFGVLADLFSVQTRGKATGIYLFGPSIGGSVGPFMAGIIVRSLGWRFAFLITSFVVTMFWFILWWFPECINQPTLPSPIQVYRKEETKGLVKNLGVKWNKPANPFLFLGILKQPIIILTLISTCLTFIPAILIASIYPILITDIYKLSPVQLGLCLIVNGAADSTGVILGGKLSDWFFVKETQKGNLPLIELRMKPVFIGAPLLIVGLSIQGFVMVTKMNIVFLLLATFVTFIGLNISLLSAISYMLDLFPKSSSQVFGTNVLMRFGLSAIFTSFNSSLITSLGLDHYYMMLIAANGVAFLVAMVIYYYGKAIRGC